MGIPYHILLLMVWLKQTCVESAIRLPRLSVVEQPAFTYYSSNNRGNPGAYSFNYDVSDGATGNAQYRSEERFANGTVAGAYGFVDAFGAPQRFRYIADQAGYRVYKERRIPYYMPTTSPRPIDKVAAVPTEGSITWSRPKRPNKNKNKNNPPTLAKTENYNYGNRRYNLVGPPSLYVDLS